MNDSRDDNALMAAFMAGDEAAFKRLYFSHKDRLYRYVRRLLLGAGRESQANDVAQATWLRVIHSRGSWSPQGAAFSTWLFTIGRNCAMDFLAKNGPLPVPEDDTDSPWEPEGTPWQSWPAPGTPRPEDVAFWRRAGEKLLACLERLPLSQRHVFLLHHEEEIPLREIAAELKVDFEAAKSRLRYAVAKLRTCMGAYMEPL